MNSIPGRSESYFIKFSQLNKQGVLILPSRRRKNEVARLWEDFALKNSENPLPLRQKLSVLTINEFFQRFGIDQSHQILSIPAQEIILRKLMNEIKDIPEKWLEIPSLPSLFRKAYSIKEFSADVTGDSFSEKIYENIRFEYIKFLEKYKLFDPEQYLKTALQGFEILDEGEVFVEFFPSATVRINYLYQLLAQHPVTFIIPEIFSDIFPQSSERYEQWQNRFTQHMLFLQPQFTQNYYSFSNNLEEISAQFDGLEKNPDLICVMADSSNYRPLFEQVGALRYLKPADSRRSLTESPFFEVFSAIINCALNLNDLSTWVDLLSPRFPLHSYSESENMLLHRFLNHFSLSGSAKGFNPNSIFLFKSLSKQLERHFNEEEVLTLKSVLEKIKPLIDSIINLKTHTSSPQKLLLSVIEILGEFVSEEKSPAALQQLEFLRQLNDLATFYGEINQGQVDLTHIQSDIKNWCTESPFDFYPYYTAFELLSLEDVKNMKEGSEIWLSGLTMDVFPAREKNENIWLSSTIKDHIIQLRQIEQKAAILQLITMFPNTLRVSFAKVVNGIPREASLLLNEEHEISKSFFQPLTKNENKHRILSFENIDKNTLPHFSPSSLNLFLKCPQRFYWKYIARVPEPEEKTDDILKSDIGTILHRILQSFFNADSTKEVLFNISDEESAFQKLSSFLTQHIKNILQRDEFRFVLDDSLNIDYLNQWVSADASNFGHLFRFLKEHLGVLSSEQGEPVNAQLQEILTEVSLKISISGIYYKGIIDRIDIYNQGNRVRLWDYKSGNTRGLLAEERDLTNIQRELYYFLYQQQAEGSGKIVVTNFQPLSEKRLSPLMDHREALKATIAKYLKDPTINSNLFNKLNELFYRLTEPEELIRARLQNDELGIHKSLLPYKDNLQLINADVVLTLRSQLLEKMTHFNEISSRFLLWLAKKSLEGPYRGIVGRNCTNCPYPSMCEYYWTQKPSSDRMDNE